MRTKLLFTLLLATFVMSCGGDDSGGDTGGIVVNGKVVDENSNPVANAVIKLDGAQTTTNSMGEFTISGGTGSAGRNFITVTSQGKFDAYRGFITQNAQQVALEVMLLDKGTSVSFNGAAGAVISNSGGNVTIAPGSIKVEGGGAYSGEVKGYLRMLNPAQPNFNQLMQGGDFAGVNASSQTGNLKSYGFYAIELEDTAGNKLNLANGATAAFSVPLAATEVPDAPQTVKLWSFDRDSGIWVEEGTATKAGNKYIGTVGHFSEWNCDDWMSVTQISGNWTAIPATQCGSGQDVVSPIASGTAYTIIYNMPTASSGTYTINEACENAGTCNVFVLHTDDQGNIYSSLDGIITKTGSNTFTFQCTIVSACDYFDSPTVFGITGNGNY